MLLAVDIGNTQIAFGLYDKQELLFSSRIASNISHTCDQYAIELKNILELYGYQTVQITGAIISSVVPGIGVYINQAINKLTGITALNIGPGIKTGLNIKVENPPQLGGDIVVGAVAAAALYRLPAIIFDFGTATKISVVDKDGCFLGCAITAGINISIEALATRTATLPFITIDIPKNIIGVNSIESMKSGLVYGAVALIDSMSERIEEELGSTATLILTGGLSGIVYGQTKREVIFSDNLLLEGLRIVFEKNRT